jgi:hypothetical protein
MSAGRLDRATGAITCDEIQGNREQGVAAEGVVGSAGSVDAKVPDGPTEATSELAP